MNYFITDGSRYIEPASGQLQRIMQQQSQFLLVEKLALALAEAAESIWESGDGYGGDVLNIIYYTFDQYGLEPNPVPLKNKYGRRPIKESLRLLIYERDGYSCLHCESKTNLSIDHIIPVALGGKNDEVNLQTLCRSCNSKKGIK